MKLLKLSLKIFIFGMTLGSCLTPELVQGSDGSWYETGRKVAYPQWEVIRAKKDLEFPSDLQIQVINYYEKRGIWPFSLTAFQEESDLNKEVLDRVAKRGFQDLLFVQQADTFLIYFRFGKKVKIKHNEVDEGYVKTNLIPGVWKFYPAESYGVKTEQDLYVGY